MASDLFAPPSKDEIKKLKRVEAPEAKDVFAPPSEDEMKGARAASVGQNQLVANMNTESEAGLPRPYEKKEEMGPTRLALDLAGRALDYTGGLVRTGAAGVAGMLKDENPVTGKDVKDTLAGKAPRSAEYLERFGVSPGPGVGGIANLRDAEGLALDIATDPLTAIVKAIKGAGAAPELSKITRSFNRPGAEDVVSAAERLKVKPTRGMLTDDYVVRNLEDSLSQAPSVPGQLVRNEQKPIQEAISGVSNKAVEGASAQSPYQAGRSIQAGVGEHFEKRYKPIQDAYSEIETHTKNVPLNPKGLDRIAKNIENLPEARFTGSEGESIAKQFSGWLRQAKDANDLKLLRSKALGIMRDPTATFEAKEAARAISKKLEQAQTNSITRQAVSIARESPIDKTAKGKFLNKAEKGVAEGEATAEGEDLGRRLVGDIKSTNKKYRGLIQDVQKFGEGSGLTKGDKGMAAALEDIRSTPPEKLPEAIFDTNNLDYMSFVKKNMPEQFESARQMRLQEIAQKAQSPTGALDPKKLQKLVGKLLNDSPEAAEMIFGKQALEELKDAGTLIKSIPGKVGASDTPRGLEFHDVMNPMQNVRDIGRYGLLKNKETLSNPGALVKKGLMNRPVRRGLIRSLRDEEGE